MPKSYMGQDPFLSNQQLGAGGLFGEGAASPACPPAAHCCARPDKGLAVFGGGGAMNESRFVIRTIRKGRVKVYGRIFAPEEQFYPYDGRLDGMRYVFGRYQGTEGYLPLLALWGTQEQYKASCEEPFLPDGPELVNDAYPWYWWHAIKEVEESP